MKIQYAPTSSFHNSKWSQERCFMLYVCSTRLFKECSMKEATGQLIASFVEQFKLNLENTRWLNFSFMLLNQVNRHVLYGLPTIQDFVKCALRKKQLIAFVQHIKEKPREKHCKHYLIALLACMQGGLRKKQLIFSFVNHFIENGEYYMHCFLVSSPKIKSREVFQTVCLLYLAMYTALYERRNWYLLSYSTLKKIMKIQ